MEKLDTQRRAHARSLLRPQRPLQPTRYETVFCGKAFPPQGPPMDCPDKALLARVPRRYLGRRTTLVNSFIQILSRPKACRKDRERLAPSCPEGPSSRTEHVALGAPLRYPEDGHVVQPSLGHEGCRASASQAPPPSYNYEVGPFNFQPMAHEIRSKCSGQSR